MNAQEQWKSIYRRWRNDTSSITHSEWEQFYEGGGRPIVKQAALERKLEAAQREIEALNDRIDRLTDWDAGRS